MAPLPLLNCIFFYKRLYLAVSSLLIRPLLGGYEESSTTTGYISKSVDEKKGRCWIGSLRFPPRYWALGLIRFDI